MTTNGRTYTSHPPKITLTQALASRFVLAGQTYTVRSCPVGVLKQLVESRTEGTKHKDLMELPALLDADSEDTTRWYVLETLMRHKCSIPFAVEEVSAY